MMECYERDYRLALIDLFPAIGLKYAHLPTFKRIFAPTGTTSLLFFSPLLLSLKLTYYWTEVNLRKHLEQFARSLRLDPLEASTWFTITPTKLLDMKVFSSFLFIFIYIHLLLIYIQCIMSLSTVSYSFSREEAVFWMC